MGKNPATGRRDIDFRITLLVAIFAIMVVMTTATVTVILGVASGAANESAINLFEAAAISAYATIDSFLGEAGWLVTAASAVPTLGVSPDDAGLEHPARAFFERGLASFPNLYSIYVGYANSEFLQMIDAAGEAELLAERGAPTGTRFLLRTITVDDTVRTEAWTFLDGSGNVLGSTTEENPEYDPRGRPWYISANRVTTVFTDPYIFASLQSPGLTAARRLSDTNGVVGVDIALDVVQEFVDQYDGIPGGGLLVVDSVGKVIAVHRDVQAFLELDITATMLPELPAEIGALAIGFTPVPDSNWIAYRLAKQNFSGREWHIVALAPWASFSGPFDRLRRRVLVMVLILIALVTPIVMRISASMTRVLTVLATDAERIARLEFGETPHLKTRIKEFNTLATGFSFMKETIAHRTGELNTTMDRLQTLIELNIAIAAEKSIDRLSELILSGARQLSHADGGSLYLVNESRDALDFQIVLNETLGFAQGGTSENAVTLPSVVLYDEQGNPNEHNVVTHTFHSGNTVNIDDAYDATGFDFSGTRQFDRVNGYRSQSFLTVPLKPRGAGIIGAMQLINSIDPVSGEIVPFSPEIQRFVEALASGAATALYNRDLLEVQKRLFDSLIRLVADAIDAKSPYTGGHCARVPEIAMLLAREAERCEKGSLAGFTMGSEEEWRAFRLGAWLHDAGKVTTPEFVVDKATKLETIYDRIHEIRTRFEVLLRDARIEMYEQVLAGESRSTAEEHYRQRAEELQADFTFVAATNLGGEMLSEDDQARIRSIAERRWLRHFDDRIGVSWAELERYTESSGSSAEVVSIDAPVEEQLLADKPQHRIPRSIDVDKTYGKFDFKLTIPELLYNRGEVYNLTIERGTLTAEERFKINEHVMQTIAMLDNLPLPSELGRVVEYAGTHHEALNGSGYPRCLTEGELSIPARIMAIADIFEALTASDRPYKKPKPLSVVIDILHRFKTDGHIDGEIFDLFLTSGVYRRYAEQYLKPYQIDEVDIEKYVG